MVKWEHAVPVPSGAIAGETHVFHAGFRSGAEPIASALVAVPRRGGRGAAARRAGGPWWAAVVGLLGNTRQWSKAGDPAEVVRPWLGLGAHTPQPALFERGIAVLLACCGLPQFEIGDAEGVDHVVFDDGPRPGVLLVSCTTSANIGEKIAPVGRQRAAVAQLVPDAAVEAAIAAPLDATVVRKLDADDCRNKGIRLLLRPEIEALFDVLRSGSPAEARASARRVVFGITVPDDLRA
jgi:hypothetical protein